VDKLEITGGVSHQREEPPNPAPLRQDIHPDRHRQHYALPGNRSLINHPKYTHTTTFSQNFYFLFCVALPQTVQNVFPFFRRDARVLGRTVEHQKPPRHKPRRSCHPRHVKHPFPPPAVDDEAAHGVR
jgi:hypothetical protein